MRYTIRVVEERVLSLWVEAESDAAAWAGDYEELSSQVLDDCRSTTVENVCHLSGGIVRRPVEP